MTPANIDDFRILARRRIPRFLADYIDGGSYAETTLRRNVEDLQAIALRQRVLRDVSALDPSATILGQPARLPVVLAPVGLAGLNARRGEVQAARAAEAAGVPFTLSTVSACSVEEVRAACKSDVWFQLYIVRDRGFMRAMIGRALAAGCTTLVLTVDLPVPGARPRDVRSGLSGSSGISGALRRAGQIALRPAWAWDVGLHGRPHTLGNLAGMLGAGAALGDFLAWIGANFDPAVSFRDLEEVRALWPGRLVVKGILDADDAREAVARGADGIVVSNHGGRQLDGAPSTVSVLPEIAGAVRGQAAVLADGGVRSGLDVLRMLARGADAVMLGRAWVWALAAGGEAGVARMLSMIEAELRVAMALTGCRRLGEIGPDVLWSDPQQSPGRPVG